MLLVLPWEPKNSAGWEVTVGCSSPRRSHVTPLERQVGVSEHNELLFFKALR